MTATVRTFLAVDPPAPTRDALIALRGHLEADQPGLRWVGPDQLHLTLAFLGDLPADRLDGLGEAIAGSVAPLEPFSLTVAGLGAFPKPGRARVLWAGLVGDDLPRLDALHRAVADAARRAGCPPADDRFSPHLTLARPRGDRGRRGPSGLDLSAVIDAHRSWTAGPLPVEAVVAYRSDLTPDGPRYTALHAAPLAA